MRNTRRNSGALFRCSPTAVSVATTPPSSRRSRPDSVPRGLHDYRDATHEQIRRLRREVDAAASALEEFAGKTVNGGDDHEKELKNLLKKLEAVSFTDRLDEIRGDPWFRRALWRVLSR